MPEPISLNNYNNINQKIEVLERNLQNQNDKIIKLEMRQDNFEKELKESINIGREIKIQNARFEMALESNTKILEENRKDMKELRDIITKINLDTSKNTDTRLTSKQIAVSLIISILMLLITIGLTKMGLSK